MCRPEVCNLGVIKPLNIQTMHFTKVQISEIIRKHADLKFSINFASSLLRPTCLSHTPAIPDGVGQAVGTYRGASSMQVVFHRVCLRSVCLRSDDAKLMNNFVFHIKKANFML